MPKRTGALTDEELADLGREYKKQSGREKRASERKRKAGAKILTELAARGTTTIETSGVRIHRTTQTRTIYNFRGLCDVLPKGVINRIRPEAVDPSALSRLVQNGTIPLDVVEKNSEVIPHAEYPTISMLAED